MDDRMICYMFDKLLITHMMNEWEHFLNERLEWMIKIITNEGTEWE